MRVCLLCMVQHSPHHAFTQQDIFYTRHSPYHDASSSCVKKDIYHTTCKQESGHQPHQTVTTPEIHHTRLFARCNICCQLSETTGCFFSLGLPLKCLSTKKLILASLGVSRRIYVNVDSPNLGFPYFNFLGEAQCKKTPCISPNCWQNISNTKM